MVVNKGKKSGCRGIADYGKIVEGVGVVSGE